MKTKEEILAEIQSLMNELVANHSAALATFLVTYTNREQTELNA